jgi:hypothetical protein
MSSETGFGLGTRLRAALLRLVLGKFCFQNFLYKIREAPIFCLSERNQFRFQPSLKLERDSRIFHLSRIIQRKTSPYQARRPHALDIPRGSEVIYSKTK